MGSGLPHGERLDCVVVTKYIFVWGNPSVCTVTCYRGCICGTTLLLGLYWGCSFINRGRNYLVEGWETGDKYTQSNA